MSMENVKKFMELVKAEESLAKRMVALKDGLQEGEFNFKNDKEFVEKKILPLAKEYGIEFSVEDFMEFTSSQLTSLSEDELAEISGGFTGLGLIVGLSLLIGGGAMTTAAQKTVSYFTGGGTPTSTVQSVTDKDVDKPIARGTEQTAESQQQREINKNFKKFVSQKKKELKEMLNDVTYLSPSARTAKINEIVKRLSGPTEDGQTIIADYNKATDDITFKSDKASQTETLFDAVRGPLYEAQAKLLHQLNAIYRSKVDASTAKEAKKKRNNILEQEFNYFYGKLVEALKNEKEITQLAEATKTADAKNALANKIKEKADTIVKYTLNAQLLNDCKIDVKQTELELSVAIIYKGAGWHDEFSVDDFIPEENHLKIINSEASKKRDEVAKKLAKYIKGHYTKAADSDQLKSSIQSVFTELKDGKLNELNLGIEIVNITNNQVTFAVSSGGKKQNTTLPLESIAEEYNKMVKMHAMEATRQQNEGAIEYTPFGRKLWNSIGSQAQHVLNTIAQIEQATGNLSDVKNHEAFENDLKYVADRILALGKTPYGLQGDHHTDTSIKAEDLQKIQKFASKIGQ